MESLNQMLEGELSEAFEVKNPKSLHRYIILLTENLVQNKEYQIEQYSMKSDLRELINLSRDRFESVQKQMDNRFKDMQTQMDQRFKDIQTQMDNRFKDIQTQMDNRFKDIQTQMDQRFAAVDRRFDDMNKRFTSLTWLISVGFVVINLLIIVFKFFYP